MPRAGAPLRLSAFGTSLVGHLLLAVALVLALRAAPEKPEVLTRLVFMDAPPPPPPPAKAAVAEPVPPKPRPVEKKVTRKPVAKPVAAPVEVAQPVVPAPPLEEAPPPAPTGGVEGGMAGGVAGGTGSAPVPVGQVARPPVLVHRVVPQYPPAAKRRGVTGMVRLEAVLDIRGRIEDSIRVLQSIPDLDEAATAALRQWRFAPARDQFGEPVRVVLEVPIQFVLR